MTDIALEVAYNSAAPADEQRDAMTVATQAAMPSTVRDMMPVIEFMQQAQEEADFHKSLMKPNVIPFPSRAVQQGSKGMQSIYLDDRRVQMLGDYYERHGSFGFDMMRNMVDNTPVLSAVILTRQRQVKRFCRLQEGGKGPGFAIRLKDQSAKLGKNETESIKLLEGFFTNCGWESNPRQRTRLRRDNFSGLMSKLIRDSLIMDSAPIETEWKRDKQLGLDGMYAVDGATIRLCSEDGYRGDDEIFALQVVEGNLRTAYTVDDLIYVPRNPRTDVMVGGYGMSETELLITTVTGLLNAMTYNNKYFDSNAIPKGMLHLSGDYSNEDLSAFKRYWNAMVKGINNAWTLPVMVSKNQESKASFENFGVDVNEVMFAKWMELLTSIICAIYGMSPDEINFSTFNSGASPLSGSDTEEKLINSKDKGLRPLLSHFEDLFSDYVVSEFGDKYVFRWTGLDETTPEQAWIEENALSTVNEARKARGQDELDWGDCPLNQVTMGAYMQSQQPAPEADDYGNPDAPANPSQPGANPAAPGQPAGKPPVPGNPAKPQKPENPQDMAKSFGLPIFRVDP